MLPDFPKIKEEIHALFMRAMHVSDSQLASLADSVPHRRYHEGTGITLVRADGSKDTIDPQEFSSETTFKNEEYGHITLKESFGRYQKTISELAIQRDAFFIEKISEAVKSVGNEIDVRDRTIDPDLVMEALDLVQVDFDEQGELVWPTLILAPEMAKKYEYVLEQLEEEPYLSKMKSLVAKKRREWNDRENRRKLVD